MTIPTLTARGKELAAVALIVLALIGASYAVGQAHGKTVAKNAADVANEAKLRDTVLAFQKQAEALEASATAREEAAARAALATAKVSAKTDTATKAEAAVASRALQVAHDSLATVPALVAQIDSVAAADSVLRINVLHMQASYATTLALKDSALLAKDSALAVSGVALERALADVKAQDQIIADLKALQPGVLHRGFRGVEAAVAGLACGAIGTLASPVVAIAAGVACAGVAGAALP